MKQYLRSQMPRWHLPRLPYSGKLIRSEICRSGELVNYCPGEGIGNITILGQCTEVVLGIKDERELSYAHKDFFDMSSPISIFRSPWDGQPMVIPYIKGICFSINDENNVLENITRILVDIVECPPHHGLIYFIDSCSGIIRSAKDHEIACYGPTISLTLKVRDISMLDEDFSIKYGNDDNAAMHLRNVDSSEYWTYVQHIQGDDEDIDDIDLNELLIDFEWYMPKIITEYKGSVSYYHAALSVLDIVGEDYTAVAFN